MRREAPHFTVKFFRFPWKAVFGSGYQLKAEKAEKRDHHTFPLIFVASRGKPAIGHRRNRKILDKTPIVQAVAVVIGYDYNRLTPST